ncbi:MAG: NAD(P)H-dependent oxidoreductase subunit E [Lentisphaeria bacterium]|jgi:NADH:ubiquinone oxidoreductase subunit F (NADH-binding)/NADH:ubiquinone oxidoreductase subunit E|nr:NAD(P)H-dependent oxidoreductase subunit E [Lentisphaeria bacterium]
MPDVTREDIERLVQAHGRGPASLLPLLQAIQKVHNYLPEEALRLIPELTDIRAADVVGVATFYAGFRLRPAGLHDVKVCIGTACHVQGANEIYEAFRKTLGIPVGEDTDADRLFTVRKVACLGCCMLAPAVQIDDITYGFLTPARAEEVLQDFLRQAADGGGKTPRPGRGGAEVRLCLCSSCAAAGAAKVAAAVREEIARYDLPAELKSVGCTGISFEAPLLEIEAGGQTYRYGRVRPENVRDILTRHLAPGGALPPVRARLATLLERLYEGPYHEPVTRYLLDEGREDIRAYTGPQHVRALADAGQAGPLDVDGYLARGGFASLEECRRHKDPEWVLHTLTAHGMRGRGGGGFPTASKWRAVREAPGADKVIVCNADEGDPGAFMDRMILESFPFRVIEGMAVAAWTVGANEGVFYIRSEYPLAVARIGEALRLCRERGLLDAGFNLRIYEGAGAFVCGEETALIASLEGRRGIPRLRPPYPSEHGLFGRPTLINNVETFANVPWLLHHPVQEEVGTAASRGTKVFALAGKVRRGGLIEVPMGMTLRRIVEEIGGGVPEGRTLKAVQVGGPSGGCVPAALCDTPVDYEALTEIGAMMGSGGLVVLDDTDCMVDVARYFMAFTQLESCGKCTFCRVGTKRMLEILECLCAGEGREGDLEELEELGRLTRAGSLCGLGRTAPNPVLTTLRFFREEYAAHLDKRCPAGTCKALITYSINDQCIGCTRCAQRCPADAIEPRPYQQHEIDPEKCVRCDACRQACPVDAIEVK